MTTNGTQVVERPGAAVAVQVPAGGALAPTAEAVEFDLWQRKARLFASSPLVPAHIGDGGSPKGVANCYIALVLAKEMGENPLVVMQNIYIVHGRAGWSASYMIAKANASGVFKGVIRFKYTGSGATRACTAYATVADTGETVESTVSLEMATAEGWAKNAKYKTLPDQMLAYRAATFLIRLYCPQVMLGYRTAEENEDTSFAGLAPDRPALSIAAVTEDAEAAPPAAAAAVTAPSTQGGEGQPALRPDQQQFRDLLDAYQNAGGDPGAWLFEKNYPDEGRALEASKPTLSKLISQLTKDTDQLRARSGGGGLPGMAGQDVVDAING